MAIVLEVGADLTFEVQATGGESVHGTIVGTGRSFDVTVDQPGAFAGRSDAPAIRGLAGMLASQGVVVRVFSADVHLVTIGAVRAGWLQRRATRSRHIRIGSLRGALTAARAQGRSGDVSVLPDGDLTPAATLFPVAPTFMRRPRRVLAGTVAHRGAGSPRLNTVPGARRIVGGPATYWLTEEIVTLGSAPDCDIVMPGLEEHHAEIHHDERDEYVVVAVAGTTRVNGAGVRRSLLRTGSRLQVGEWTLTFAREEFADHGRPFGGREGGEIGFQRSQPRPRRT